jgi:hypothetical protein
VPRSCRAEIYPPPTFRGDLSATRLTFLTDYSRPERDFLVLSREDGPGELTVLQLVGANDLDDYQQLRGTGKRCMAASE